MSLNSSSSFNVSLPPSLFPSISLYSVLHICFTSKDGAFSVTTFTIISILLLLPLYIFILYLGLQRWRQQRSNMTMSHSDVFTYHMVLIELLSIIGSVLMCCGVFTDLPKMIRAGLHIFMINLTGQMLFHLLTCVERYLAVVHPITYLSLRKERGIRLRNITIGFTWLLCFASTGVLPMDDHLTPIIISAVFIAIALIVVSFCSVSVLCVLIRRGPGEAGRCRDRVDQSKLRPFYTILAILGVLLFRLAGNILTTVMYSLPQLLEKGGCGVWLSEAWFCVPSSLVLPLLFLQRAGKLLCCKNNGESGQDSH